jgi:succinate dehydrogenase / fumarate reductase iron-sulfur subunit
MARKSKKLKELKVKVDVFRLDPSVDKRPHRQVYVVPIQKGMSVSNLLQHIWECIDPSLAFYLCCRVGRCHGCFVEVNGQVKLACTTLVEGDLAINPWPKYEVIRDLVVDITRPKTY